MFEYEKAPGKPFFAARITDVEQRCSCGEYFIRSDTLLSIKSSSLFSPIGWLWRPGRLSSRSFAQRHVSSPPRPTTWDGCFRGAAGCRSAPLPPPECSDETVGVQSKAACFACKTNNKPPSADLHQKQRLVAARLPSQDRVLHLNLWPADAEGANRETNMSLLPLAESQRRHHGLVSSRDPCRLMMVSLQALLRVCFPFFFAPSQTPDASLTACEG
jgi:hypothetical protein